MKIITQGVTRKAERSDILKGDRDSEIIWDKESKSIKLRVKNIRRYNSTYNYDVFLSIDEVQRIMGVLAEKGVVYCQSEISQKFAPQLDKLLKIMMCSVGIVAQKKQG